MQLKEQLKAAGVTIIESSEIDMEAFRQAGETAYEALKLTDVRDTIYQQLGK